MTVESNRNTIFLQLSSAKSFIKFQLGDCRLFSCAAQDCLLCDGKVGNSVSAQGLLEPAFAAVYKELMRHIGDNPTASTHATKESVKDTLTVTSEQSHEIRFTDMNINDTLKHP